MKGTKGFQKRNTEALKKKSVQKKVAATLNSKNHRRASVARGKQCSVHGLVFQGVRYPPCSCGIGKEGEKVGCGRLYYANKNERQAHHCFATHTRASDRPVSGCDDVLICQCHYTGSEAAPGLSDQPDEGRKVSITMRSSASSEDVGSSRRKRQLDREAEAEMLEREAEAASGEAKRRKEKRESDALRAENQELRQAVRQLKEALDEADAREKERGDDHPVFNIGAAVKSFKAAAKKVKKMASLPTVKEMEELIPAGEKCARLVWDVIGALRKEKEGLHAYHRRSNILHAVDQGCNHLYKCVAIAGGVTVK